MEYVTLNNGIKMPKLGYGVYQLSNEECERCVLDAISAGYRSIDTAQSYGNEEAVGNAINKCGVPREELFITTKVWITNGGYEKAKESLATVYKGNIIKNLIMDCQSYTKYRPNETTGGIFVSWRRKEELPTGA